MHNTSHVMPRAFGSFIEDIFNNGLNKARGEESLNDRSDAPVNIQETEKYYELHLVAPGLKKEDFKINVDKNILTISFEHKEEETEVAGKWLRKEYKMKSFKRSFTLNEKVDPSGITARYTDGILNVSLPKKELTEEPVQAINVQ